MHCTGIPAMHAPTERLPGRVIYNSTGTQYNFGAEALAHLNGRSISSFFEKRGCTCKV